MRGGAIIERERRRESALEEAQQRRPAAPSRHRNCCLEVRIGTGSSNPPCSTIQSLDFQTSRRIARKPRARARFAISADPESGSKGSDSPESANSSLGAIYLGPPSIAIHSPFGLADIRTLARFLFNERYSQRRSQISSFSARFRERPIIA